jgi:hypothetical protein
MIFNKSTLDSALSNISKRKYNTDLLYNDPLVANSDKGAKQIPQEQLQRIQQRVKDVTMTKPPLQPGEVENEGYKASAQTNMYYQEEEEEK